MRLFNIFSISFLLIPILSANETITYTLNGQKDPRLGAVYELTYVATNKEKECTEKRENSLVAKTKKELFEVNEDTYNLRIIVNATPKEDDKCAYEFQSLNLIVKRLYDEERYNQFPVVGRYPSASPRQKGNWAIPVYNGTKEGTALPLGFFNKRNKIPYAYRSDENYFRLLYQTRFNCMTSRTDESTHAEFMCLMDISDPLYRYQPCDSSSPKPQDECGTVHHSQFEINRLIDQTFTIDIIADDSKSMKWNTSKLTMENDTFQMPNPSVWEKFKHLFTPFTLDIFPF
ncbi:hypothetical protein Sulku_1092 [Sulfuricurvum kujiense DSM 16994]|uniref:Uncharacterized protein n=1 Tax=Sulfuricurvum kujiense (strain ATCC BAA-921 / DSM 16994 / JCM 11577 / YK-1) TaxID=709032 RepID=E4TWD7_SULKY|nr:hypothetical protein [Sulfuricurvum kujiense]ADR33755.1 hypothetical protein Sulku_1092 [Sulfuricurvum kujiense DSM 16994]